ncbi:hypothetical protein AVEN_46292-1 [Araneus ventricosus]|uniref:Uncharacterized protein n=1 Tax=Araneus ventricosus TaxID=182803 RepID=A0A4Y2MRE9_ARAVE|nr:hypothetical protein AVEN_46292-1 [Araneus ventricosus]
MPDSASTATRYQCHTERFHPVNSVIHNPPSPTVSTERSVSSVTLYIAPTEGFSGSHQQPEMLPVVNSVIESNSTPSEDSSRNIPHSDFTFAIASVVLGVWLFAVGLVVVFRILVFIYYWSKTWGVEQHIAHSSYNSTASDTPDSLRNTSFI